MDKEKVIKEFELFIKEFHPACTSEGVELDMFREVLALIKEQEPIEPYVTGNGESFETAKNWWYECGNCNNPIDSTDKFCRHCGRMVKWE